MVDRRTPRIRQRAHPSELRNGGYIQPTRSPHEGYYPDSSRAALSEPVDILGRLRGEYESYSSSRRDEILKWGAIMVLGGAVVVGGALTALALGFFDDAIRYKGR